MPPNLALGSSVVNLTGALDLWSEKREEFWTLFEKKKRNVLYFVWAREVNSLDIV